MDQKLERTRRICRDALIKIIEENGGSDIDVIHRILA